MNLRRIFSAASIVPHHEDGEASPGDTNVASIPGGDNPLSDGKFTWPVIRVALVLPNLAPVDHTSLCRRWESNRLLDRERVSYCICKTLDSPELPKSLNLVARRLRGGALASKQKVGGSNPSGRATCSLQNEVSQTASIDQRAWSLPAVTFGT